MINDVLPNELKGLKIKSISGMEIDSKVVYIILENDKYVDMSSTEDTRNDVKVWLEDIVGKPQKHIGATLNNIIKKTGSSKSGTYTFYTIQTSKGYLDLRWNGYSNGYYSEECQINFKFKRV